jgi:hypothetical protein
MTPLTAIGAAATLCTKAQSLAAVRAVTLPASFLHDPLGA